MTEEQKKLKERFLEPETRDGYFIDAKMKAAWKEMLNIVEVFVRICDRHGLNYSLAGGSLLGAVRHKGFIPWDDDIDIDMPREDYEKLLKILPDELENPYVLQTPVTDPERVVNFAQIRNPNTTAIDRYWVKCGFRFNMGIGIDIFPIDGVPESLSARMVTGLIVQSTERILRFANARKCENLWRCLKKWISTLFLVFPGRRLLWRLHEWAYARNDMWECSQCGEYSFLPKSPRARWTARCYSSYLTVPFEYLDLKISAGYDEVLTAKYGDWRKPSRDGGYHVEPLILDAAKPYKEVLVQKFEYKPEWIESLP